MRLRVEVVLSTAVLIVFTGCLVTISSSSETCFSRQQSQEKKYSELQHILNISCADNGTIAITWNVRSALYLFIQIEYQCYYGSYNESKNNISVDWVMEAFEGMKTIDNVVGSTCTVAGCGEKSGRKPQIFKFKSENCTLNLTGGTPSTKHMLLPSKPGDDNTMTISTALSSMYSSSFSLSSSSSTSSTSSTSLSSTTATVSTTSHVPTNTTPPPTSKSRQPNLDSTATIIIALVALILSITIGSIVVFMTCACTFGKAWRRNQSIVISDLNQADVFQKIELNKFSSMDSIVTALGVIRPFSGVDIIPMNESPQLTAKLTNRIASPSPEPSLSNSEEETKDTDSESQSDVSQVICEKPVPTTIISTSDSPKKSVMTTEYITMDSSKPEEDTSSYRPDNHEPSFKDSGVYDFRGSPDYIQLSEQVALPPVSSLEYIEYDDSSLGYISSEKYNYLTQQQ